MPGNNRAIFLDRDGTIVEDPGYLTKPEQVRLLPGAADAIARLRKAGFLVIVVTNQSAIARGLMTEDDLTAVHKRLIDALAEANPAARLDAIYYCPFHPEAPVAAYRQESYLRKPRPGMLFKAAREYQLDLGSCWLIGDSEKDVQAGKTAGCRAIRLDRDSNVETMADRILSTLAEAADVVLATPGRAPLRTARTSEEVAPSELAAPTSDPSVSPPPSPSEAPPEQPAAVRSDAVRRSQDALTGTLQTGVPPAPAPAEPLEPAAAELSAATPSEAAAPAEAAVAAGSVAPPDAAPAVGLQLDLSHAARPLGSTKERLLREIEMERQQQKEKAAAESAAVQAAAAATAPAPTSVVSDEPSASPPASATHRPLNSGDMRHTLAEILQQLRQVNRGPNKHEISATKILGGLFQITSWLFFVVAMITYWEAKNELSMERAMVWALGGIFIQLASVAFLTMYRQE